LVAFVKKKKKVFGSTTLIKKVSFLSFNLSKLLRIDHFYHIIDKLCRDGKEGGLLHLGLTHF